MKTNRILIALAVAAIVAPSFQSCKKGENDPFLSLRSRKARVAGEWDVTKHVVEKEIIVKSSNVTSKEEVTETFENNTFTSVTTTSAGAKTKTYASTRDMSFTKEGTFTKNNLSTEVEVDTVFVITSSGFDYYTRTSTIVTNEVINGTWNFLNGVGEVKNKEVLNLSNVKTSVTENTDVKFAAYNGTPSDAEAVSSTSPYKEERRYSVTSNHNFEQWNLDQLKNNELIGKIEINEISEDSLNSYQVSGNASITLTAK